MKKLLIIVIVIVLVYSTALGDVINATVEYLR